MTEMSRYVTSHSFPPWCMYLVVIEKTKHVDSRPTGDRVRSGVVCGVFNIHLKATDYSLLTYIICTYPTCT
jgi:hypothetical protein